MSLTQLQADGCIAPFSPRVVGEHIVYLSKRGLMLIRGMDAVCITERFIPYRLLTAPSAFIGGLNPYQSALSVDGGASSTVYSFGIDGGNATSTYGFSYDGGGAYSTKSFWWLTTERTSSYGALLDIGQNQITYLDQFGYVTSKDKPINGVIYEARSFVWQNKYYLYFVNSPSTDFIGNPCWCVDLGIPQLAFQLPNYPITTLGFKPSDMHVTSTGECYALLTIDPVNDPYNQSNFIAAESQFNTIVNPQVTTQAQALYRFNPTYGQNVPVRFRTSEVTGDSPQTRKRWREVRLNGIGTCSVRVFIDGALLTTANGNTSNTLVLSESPIHPSRILLPFGSWGYACSIECCGDCTVRLIEFAYDPMAGEDNPPEGKE
jgi:hypothetical protein